MLLTIITFWAIIIPVAVLAFSWEAARRRESGAARAHARSVAEEHRRPSHTGTTPACAMRPVRPRRTVTRRVCPEHPRGAGRRSASA
jgi:hypothetical protein